MAVATSGRCLGSPHPAPAPRLRAPPLSARCRSGSGKRRPPTAGPDLGGWGRPLAGSRSHAMAPPDVRAQRAAPGAGSSLLPTSVLGRAQPASCESAVTATRTTDFPARRGLPHLSPLPHPKASRPPWPPAELGPHVVWGFLVRCAAHGPSQHPPTLVLLSDGTWGTSLWTSQAPRGCTSCEHPGRWAAGFVAAAEQGPCSQELDRPHRRRVGWGAGRGGGGEDKGRPAARATRGPCRPPLRVHRLAGLWEPAEPAPGSPCDFRYEVFFLNSQRRGLSSYFCYCFRAGTEASL